MRLETLSILATLAAGGLQLVAADDAPEHRERPRYLARNIKRTVTDVTYDKPEESNLEARGGIASLLNGLGDAVNSGSSEPTTSEPTTSSPKKGKEVVVVVSQDREGHLHTLTTSTRLGAEPTDKAVTSTVDDDSSPAPAPATPSSTPASATEDSKKNPGIAGGLNKLLGGDSDSKTSTSSSAPATPSSAPATSSKDSSNLLNLDADVNGLLGDKSDSTTATSSSAPSTPAATTKDSKNPLNLGDDVKDLLGAKSDSTTATSSSAPSTPAATTKDSKNPLNLGDDVKGLLGAKSDSTTATSSSAPSTPAATTKDSNNLLNLDADVNGLLGAKSDSKTATSSSAPVTSTPATSTKDSKDPLDLGSGLKDLGDGVSKVLNPNSNATTGSSTPLTTGSPSSPSTTDKNLLEQLLGDKSKSNSASSIIPVSVPVSPSATPSSSFDPVGDLTNGASGLLNGSSNAQSLIPTPSSPLGVPKPSNSLGGVPSASIPLSGSPTNSVGSVPVPHAPSSGPSDKPFGSGSAASGSVPIPTGPAQESSKVIPAPSSTPLPQSTEPVTTSIVAPQTTSTSRPASTESDWMPSSILVLPTHPVSESTSTNTKTQGEATSLPGSITPNDASIPPENSLLLQLGFDGSLPWSFVATTPLSTSQIFQYVPKALSYAVPKFGSVATMYALQPYYNWKQTGYNATIAVFYFPRDGLDALKKLHSNPNSALYKDNDNQAVSTLMTMIDPTIPLVYNGNTPSDDDGSDSSGNGSNDGGDDNNGNNVDGGSSSSGKGKASAAGIATGAVAGAAAYGAAMFWVARRYRKRRQLHQRASSTGDAMSQNSAAASAAGAGSQRTARSQMISAPVMAENSLGWN